jgi:hypothetical protein
MLERLKFTDGGAPERIPLTELALAKSFRYVDEVLYVRQTHALKYEERHPDTAYARAVALGFIGDLQFLRTLLVNLLTSRLVPLARKLLIPLVVGRFAAGKIHVRYIRPLRRRRKPKAKKAGFGLRVLAPAQARLKAWLAPPPGPSRPVLRWESGTLVSVSVPEILDKARPGSLNPPGYFKAKQSRDGVVFTRVRSLPAAPKPPQVEPDAPKIKVGWEDEVLTRIRIEDVFKDRDIGDITNEVSVFRAMRKGDSIVFSLIPAGKAGKITRR